MARYPQSGIVERRMVFDLGRVCDPLGYMDLTNRAGKKIGNATRARFDKAETYTCSLTKAGWIIAKALPTLPDDRIIAQTHANEAVRLGRETDVETALMFSRGAFWHANEGVIFRLLPALMHFVEQGGGESRYWRGHSPILAPFTLRSDENYSVQIGDTKSESALWGGAPNLDAACVLNELATAGLIEPMIVNSTNPMIVITSSGLALARAFVEAEPHAYTIRHPIRSKLFRTCPRTGDYTLVA